MPRELHENLCRKGVAWLKRNGFGVAAMNIWATGSRERVDCIGFRASSSVLIESKVSRADFFADKKKPERTSGGVGVYRFYITPKDMLSISDLPPKWGLLEVHGRSIKMKHGPTGNLWPAIENIHLLNTPNSSWADFAHQHDKVAERSILFSIARRALAN